MTSRKEAEELFYKLRAARSKAFLGKLDESQRGINFVLVYLQETDKEVIAGDLARTLNVSTARIAAMLKTMEKNEWIIRYHSPMDARQTVVEITPKGMEYADQIKEQVLEKIELLLEKIGREELEEFIRISLKIKEALEK